MKNQMRIVAGLCIAVLFSCCCSVMPAIAGPCIEDSEPPGIYVPERGCFEFGLGYQYQHFDVLSTRFHTNAYNADFGMHLVDLVTGAAGRLTGGVEGVITAGFGGHAGGESCLACEDIIPGSRAAPRYRECVTI